MIDKFMRRAIDEAYEGIESGAGGPFGAVIVQEGRIVSSAHNRVVESHDPTAHAEILAIREAGRVLGRFDLSGCRLYTTCEPCPMCRSAVHWARITEVIYGCGREDAAEIGFDDALLYDIFAGRLDPPAYQERTEGREACLALFREFERRDDRVMY